MSTRPRPLLVLDVVGLTPRLLDPMPHLKALAASGSQAPLSTVLPAATCTAQSTCLIAGDKLWDAARRAHPGCTVANICRWYAMGAGTDITVTPRPICYADGRKEPDGCTRPAALHDELTARLGTFPILSFWRPGADIVSSRWIAEATRYVMRTLRPDLTLCYLPHLDYDLQRVGPDDPRSHRAAAELDAVSGPLLADARPEGRTVVALSEYGVTRDDGKKANGLDHPRSGELVAVTGRLVHVLLLARRRPRPRLRPARRDPPQTRLRPRRAVHGARRSLCAAQGGQGGGPQEARRALPARRRPPRPLTRTRQPRPPPPPSDEEGPLVLLSTPPARYPAAQRPPR